MDHDKIAQFARIYGRMGTARLRELIEQETQRYLADPAAWTENDMDHKTALLTALRAKEEAQR